MQAEQKSDVLERKSLEWVLHLLKGDCMYLFGENDFDNYKYFREQYRTLKTSLLYSLDPKE